MASGATERRVFGNLAQVGLEVVERDGRHFLRYDAGAHQIAWREDEITAQELALLQHDRAAEQQVILQLQQRLQRAGIDPYRQNWTPNSQAPQGEPS
jgi:hypothetical protein